MGKIKDTKDSDNLLILMQRQYKVVKHNDIVQKSRYSLSLTEQKTLNFLISLIKPQKDNEEPILEYTFDIQTYCKTCGINSKSGENYNMVRRNLKSLRDKSFWITLDEGTETTVSWINKPWCNKGTGQIKVRFDEDMIPYLFNLRGMTTRYELYYIMKMKSKYSIPMYELLRSYSEFGYKRISIEKIRNMLCLKETELKNFADFNRSVLTRSKKEINEYTDIIVDFTPLKVYESKYDMIEFRIKKKPASLIKFKE